MKYGDIDNVQDDVITINKILGRQGSSLFIDVLAESAGRTAVTFNLSVEDRRRLTQSLVNELKEALLERL